MKKDELFVGQRVEVVRDFDRLDMTGRRGTVVEVYHHGSFDVAVEFDESFPQGYVCVAGVKDGHGRKGYASELISLEEEPVKISLSFKECLGF